MSQPTQTRHPWRATVRTTVALVVSAATVLPYVVAGLHVDAPAVSAILGQAVAVAAGITRVLALPQVELFLRQWAPWLSAEPPPVPVPPKVEETR